MTEIIIRLATPSDAGLIARISRQTFYDSFASQNTRENMDMFMNGQFTQEALKEEAGAEGNIFLLAFFQEEPAGYVRMRESKNPDELGNARAIEIARIYAASGMTSKGIGSKLMQRCIAIAVEMKMEVIWLGVWEHNLRAIDFYRKWGFEKFGEHVFMLGNDVQNDWMMKRKLLINDY
jgi:diamine N-acetyltransferase